MEHVLCVCVEHTPGGVDVMVPVIPVGRGRHPVRGKRECGSLWNDPDKKKMMQLLYFIPSETTRYTNDYHTIIEMNETLKYVVIKDFSSPFLYIYT